MMGTAVHGDKRPVVLITGATRGIGAAAAIDLGRRGAAVALTGRNADGLAATARSIRNAGGNTTEHGADLAIPHAAVDLLHDVIARHGRVDAVVCNAAQIDPIATISEATETEWQQALTVNVLAPVALVQAALPHLRPAGGRVITVGSTAATRSIRGLAAYSVTKAALRHFTTVLAEEEPRVTAISFLPGRTDTGMHLAIRERGAGVMSDAQHAHYQRLKDEGDLADPMVPATRLAWLALHAPNAWSGQEIDRLDPRLRPADPPAPED